MVLRLKLGSKKYLILSLEYSRDSESPNQRSVNLLFWNPPSSVKSRVSPLGQSCSILSVTFKSSLSFLAAYLFLQGLAGPKFGQET